MSSPSQEEKVNNKSEDIKLRREQLSHDNKKIKNHGQSIGTGCKQQNLENANIKQENAINKQGQINKQFKSVILSKLIFIGLTILQFSNLLSLILIQYISSKVRLSLFLIILIFTMVLHLILLGITCRIKLITLTDDERKFCQRQEDVLNRKNNKKQSHISTLPKINYHIRKRSLAKTKKLQYPQVNIQQQQNTQQTIKRESASIKQYIIKQESIQQQIFQQCAGYEIYCLILFKSIQIVLEVIYPTLALTLFYSEQNSHQDVAVVLSIIAYIFSGISLINFILLLKDIRCFFQAKIVNEYLLQARKHKNKNKQQIKSKVSIDQLIQIKNDQIKSILSINKSLKSSRFANEDCQKVKSQNDQEQEVHTRKMQVKKSVLKSSKKHQPRIKKSEEQEEQVVQRRRVQINSKKIQYFQYLEITPPHSVIDEQEIPTPKTPEKVNRSKKKMKYLRKQMENQAQFLKNKRMHRQAKVKSSIFLYNTKKQEIVEVGQFKKKQNNLLNYSFSL